MRHYFTTRVKVILAIALVLAVIFGVVGSASDSGGGFFQTLLTPLRSGAYALTNQVERLYNYIYNYDSLKVENQQLRQELLSWKQDDRQSDILERENQRLRELLELKEANPDYELVDAYVISRSSTDWTSTITVDRGSSSGIEAGMCVITSGGEVVGLVTEAGTNYAVIKTVLDSTLEISAKIASSGYSGTVSGSYTSGNGDMLRMEYLVSTAVIRNRDQVVTSGSTNYPRDLILGYVTEAGFDDVGVAKYAILEPAADIANLEQVFIITEYDRT